MIDLRVMQGRLLPPEPGRFQAFPPEGWERELAAAGEAGVQGVEWIYESYGANRNPLGSAEGIERLSRACDAHDARVTTLCADWFMEDPLLADPERRAADLRWLCGQAEAVGIEWMVLPFVDNSALIGDDAARLPDVLLPVAQSSAVELHLETDLGPKPFAELLERMEHPRIRANYDSGNSAAHGYDVGEEFAAYGDRIGSVHVKDRVRGGGTVPLGAGDADLPALFALLRERGWSRPLILQVARGPEGDEMATTAEHAAQVRKLWESAGR